MTDNTPTSKGMTLEIHKGDLEKISEQAKRLNIHPHELLEPWKLGHAAGERSMRERAAREVWPFITHANDPKAAMIVDVSLQFRLSENIRALPLEAEK
jgi:hypothetical protein